MRRATIADLTGKTFNRLTVVEFVRKANGSDIYLCRCVCGNTKNVRHDHLIHNNTRSCGCYRNERVKQGRINAGLIGQQLSYKELVALGKCSKCFKPNDGLGSKAYCGSCRAIVLESQRARRVRRKAEGRCTHCPEPSESGLSVCAKHRAMNAQRNRENYKKHLRMAHMTVDKAVGLVRKYTERIAELEAFLANESTKDKLNKE